MGEQAIFTTNAHVFQIDPETKKKWIPVSTTAVGVSFYHDTVRNSYRIISLDNSKPIVNSTILPNMNFSKTSQKFGQWADLRAQTVYGLGFPTELDLGKFHDKFNEVKELSQQQPLVSPATSVNIISKNDIRSELTNEFKKTLVVNDQPKQQQQQQQVTSDTDRAKILVLQSENDKLKIALAQSSSNAKQWEVEMQTLRSNNARLTAALQESGTNVEEWQRQLTSYKDERVVLTARIAELERSSGSTEMLQRQLLDAKEKLQTSERAVLQKQEEVNELKRKIDESKQMDSQNQRLNAKLQTADEEKLKLRKQMVELQQAVDDARSNRSSGRLQLQALQQQLSSKINDLYETNDKLADIIQATI